MVVQDVCPRCQSPKYKKNGHIHNGKQNHHCHDCGRQFVDGSEQYLISEDTRALIERLLVERISLRGICRAVGVTLKWLLGFLVNALKPCLIISMSSPSPVTATSCCDAWRWKRMK